MELNSFFTSEIGHSEKKAIPNMSKSHGFYWSMLRDIKKEMFRMFHYACVTFLPANPQNMLYPLFIFRNSTYRNQRDMFTVLKYGVEAFEDVVTNNIFILVTDSYRHFSWWRLGTCNFQIFFVLKTGILWKHKKFAID